MAQQSLRAVHDDDLVAVLQGLGLHGDFQRGTLRCSTCRAPITWENLHALVPVSGSIKCVCSHSACVEALLGKVQRGGPR